MVILKRKKAYIVLSKLWKDGVEANEELDNMLCSLRKDEQGLT